jgi:anthranilate/para-aminobenzoate synthase component II
MRVLITQRVDVLPERGERRDALDQAWGDTLCGMLQSPVLIHPMPNRPRDVDETIAGWRPSLIVLSGGNDIGGAPERDATEAALLGRATADRIPVLAVCRGMQMVQHFLGGSLRRVTDHVATEHLVKAEPADAMPAELLVNSFHAWGIARNALASGLETLYSHADGSVEAARHATLPWLSLMWHPERSGEGMAIANDWAGRWLREVL